MGDKQSEVNEVNESINDNDNGSNDDNEDESEEHYEVEYVVKHRKSLKKAYPKYDENNERCFEYFVKWKGWDSSTNTWEHQETLANCKKLIDAYWTKREEEQKKKEQKKKEKKVKKVNKKPKKKPKKQLSKKEEEKKEDIKEIDEIIENENEEQNEREVTVIEDEIKPQREVPRTQKLKKSKKYRARRTLIWSPDDDQNEQEEEDKCDNAQIEINEEMKTEEDSVKNNNEEEQEDEDATTRKRSFVEEIDLNEPPLKKRKLEETKKIIMSKGVDLFVDMLENGDEDIQNALVDLIQQFEAK